MGRENGRAKFWSWVARIGFGVAILSFSVALTAELEAYLHDHPNQAWDTAITAMSTVALVVSQSRCITQLSPWG